MGRLLLILAIAAWVVSLFMPVEGPEGTRGTGFDAMEASFNFNSEGGAILNFLLSAIDEEQEDSYWMSLFVRWLRWAWVANVGVLFALLALLMKESGTTALRLLCAGNLICALIAIAGVVIPLLGGQEMPCYGLGYWVWVASFGSGTLGAFLRSFE